MNGFINVLKPPGMTSHDVISFLRRTLGTKKIGHAGTLDPQAAGVLPVCVGQATRLVEHLSILNKEYLCRMTLGVISDTQDAWGTPIEYHDASAVTLNDIQRVLPLFSGEITQTVPMYSAVKKGGVPLYKLARQGKTAEPILRQVSIDSLTLLEFQSPELALLVDCSKGTYIRTLCHDIGHALGTGAVMSFLLRTRVGSFHLEDSLTLEEIAQLKERAIEQVNNKYLGLTCITLPDEEINQLKKGQSITYHESTDGQTELESTLAILDRLGQLHILAILTHSDNAKYQLKPKKVFNLE